MAFQLFSTSSAAIALLVIITVYILRYVQSSFIPQAEKESVQLDLIESSPEFTAVCDALASALPESVITPQNESAFKQSMNSYWAQQEREVVPGCVVRPRDTQELSTAVTILKREHDDRRRKRSDGNVGGLFAIRSGGHSSVASAASIKGGVLIDVSLFREVTPSEDRLSVVIGAGAKWMDVSKVLDEMGLAVVGGRNSAVGVGGLTLGGGLSFFSPQFGLVCSNIISYELVLADGSITTVSISSKPDLWRALKGGSNNFAIVTRFTARCFPAPKIWSGMLYMPSFQSNKALIAFQEFLNRADSNNPTSTYDKYAAGPIVSFSYVQQLGFQILAINLVHTNHPGKSKGWPECWQTSSFSSLWRLWSSIKLRTLTSATDEMNELNVPGRRQVFATTTIKNDLATLVAVHAAYEEAISSLRPRKVQGLVWTLTLQPLLPEWARMGDPNPQGLHNLSGEPLVIVSLINCWHKSVDDSLIKTTTRRVIEQMEALAQAHKTDHSWRYLNYCADWQKPFQSFGEENLQFLQEASRKYDPDGLFQRGCIGGFKLGV